MKLRKCLYKFSTVTLVTLSLATWASFSSSTDGSSSAVWVDVGTSESTSVCQSSSMATWQQSSRGVAMHRRHVLASQHRFLGSGISTARLGTVNCKSQSQLNDSSTPDLSIQPNGLTFSAS